MQPCDGCKGKQYIVEGTNAKSIVEEDWLLVRECHQHLYQWSIQPKHTLPYALSTGSKGVQSRRLLVKISHMVECSARSACHSASLTALGCQHSFVLKESM